MDGPFADPTLEAAMSQINENAISGGNQPRINAAVLDGYNPFVSTAGANSSENNPPPPYSTEGAKQLSTAELERRQRELDAKAAELARREEEQRAREQSRSMLPGVTKNWPPLPAACPCAPCFYQNIDVEIIPEYQKIVRWGYYLWSSYAILLLINFVGALIYFAGTDVSSGGTLFGMAILAIILCVPSSYVCWFRPLYKAFKNNSSINFLIFFFIFGAQILVMIIQSIGVLNWGSW